MMIPDSTYRLQFTPAFTFAHAGGRYADIATHDPALEVAVEIHSAWGTFEWLFTDALQHGYRIGVCANSDGHKGRPGASYPGAKRFGSYGGLTCVLAEELSRESIFQAMKARRFYATTGNRPILDVALHIGGSTVVPIGAAAKASPTSTPVMKGRIVGTGPLENVMLVNGTTPTASYYTYTNADIGRRVKILWSGAEVRGRARQATWDGHLTVKDNRISDVTAVNFWNPERSITQTDDNHLQWQSITTGGICGMILTLDEPKIGTIDIETAQGSFALQVETLQREPTIKDVGGLQKQIAAYALPDSPSPCEASIEMPVEDIHRGDNPIYLRMTQEDGHMAWTSPVYLEA